MVYFPFQGIFRQPGHRRIRTYKIFFLPSHDPVFTLFTCDQMPAPSSHAQEPLGQLAEPSPPFRRPRVSSGAPQEKTLGAGDGPHSARLVLNVWRAWEPNTPNPSTSRIDPSTSFSPKSQSIQGPIRTSHFFERPGTPVHRAGQPWFGPRRLWPRPGRRTCVSSWEREHQLGISYDPGLSE